MTSAATHTSAGEPGVAAQVYQLKVTLMEVVPRIWRRVQVPASLTLSGLSATLQIVMGWEGYHLHRFEISGTCYGNGPGDRGENQAVAEVIPPRLDTRRSPIRRPWDSVPTVFLYEYDFGDSWMHELRVERIVRRNTRMRYPRCVAGAQPAPPEDCGGPWGYSEWRAARSTDRLFDREEDDEPVHSFDLAKVNSLLRERVHGKENYGL